MLVTTKILLSILLYDSLTGSGGAWGEGLLTFLHKTPCMSHTRHTHKHRYTQHTSNTCIYVHRDTHTHTTHKCTHTTHKCTHTHMHNTRTQKMKVDKEVDKMQAVPCENKLQNQQETQGSACQTQTNLAILEFMKEDSFQGATECLHIHRQLLL